MAAFGGTGRKNPPVVRLLTPAGTAENLRVHLARHNRRVLLLAAGTLVGTLAAWALVYFVCCWLFVLAVAVLDLPWKRIPPHFPLLYIITGLCGIVYAWIDRRLTPNARLPDKKPVYEILMDFVLALPRMTLAVGATLRAWLHLSDTELLEAAELLHRLGQERRVPVTGVRLQIPDPRAAARILLALQITQLVDQFREENEYWLRLDPARPSSLRMTSEEPGGAEN
jgi:hypothetical protein